MSHGLRLVAATQLSDAERGPTDDVWLFVGESLLERGERALVGDSRQAAYRRQTPCRVFGNQVIVGDGARISPQLRLQQIPQFLRRNAGSWRSGARALAVLLRARFAAT